MYSLASEVDRDFRMTVMARRICDALERHHEIWLDDIKDIEMPSLRLQGQWKVTELLFEQARTQWRRNSFSLLDNHYINFTTTTTRAVVESVFGFYHRKRRKHYTEEELAEIELVDPDFVKRYRFEQALLDECATMAKEKRKNDLSFRLLMEAERRTRQGWFVVFNTLTFTNDRDPEYVFRQGWSKYLEKFDSAVGAAVHGSRRKAHEARKTPDGAYHSHFAVVERGGRTGRLHLHVLHFCKRLPEGCVDPNSGCVAGKRRIIDHLRSYWPYGMVQAPIAVRFSYDDAYGRIGWTWPVGARAGSPGTICGYLTKYIHKEYDAPATTFGGKRAWRTKMSHDFGLYPVKDLMTRLPEKILLGLSQLEMTTEEMRLAGRKIPVSTLRKYALREYLLRLTQWSKVSFLGKLKPADGILKRLRDSAAETLSEALLLLKTGSASTARFMDLTPRDISDVVLAIRAVDHDYFFDIFPVIGTFDARLSPGRL